MCAALLMRGPMWSVGRVEGRVLVSAGTQHDHSMALQLNCSLCQKAPGPPKKWYVAVMNLSRCGVHEDCQQSRTSCAQCNPIPRARSTVCSERGRRRDRQDGQAEAEVGTPFSMPWSQPRWASLRDCMSWGFPGRSPHTSAAKDWARGMGLVKQLHPGQGLSRQSSPQHEVAALDRRLRLST